MKMPQTYVDFQNRVLFELAVLEDQAPMFIEPTVIRVPAYGRKLTTDQIANMGRYQCLFGQQYNEIWHVCKHRPGTCQTYLEQGKCFRCSCGEVIFDDRPGTEAQ